MTEDDTLYLTPTKTAQPSIYDPLAEYQRIVLDAINIGRMGMSKKPDAEIQKAIQQFTVRYGLFGLMTALSTTPNFMEYAERYDWMKQQFIDWAFTYINSFLYYEDYDTLNDETRQMMLMCGKVTHKNLIDSHPTISSITPLSY